MGKYWFLSVFVLPGLAYRWKQLASSGACVRRLPLRVTVSLPLLQFSELLKQIMISCSKENLNRFLHRGDSRAQALSAAGGAPVAWAVQFLQTVVVSLLRPIF